LRVRALAVVAGLVLVACSGGGDDDTATGDASALQPQFEPVSTSSSTTGAGAEPGVTSTVAPSVVGSSTTGPPVPAATEPTTEASIADPGLDTTPSPLDRPPPWSDLTGARLIRSRSGFELRVRLRGGDAPETAPDDAHTMNIASFYDVDGDGTIDYEIWANLASGGWGASYFDNDRSEGSFLEESFVTVTTEGDEVVLKFALVHLDRSTRFRWSIASEWGRYGAIGTTSMVRDAAPDAGASADFPSA
jgi:hypothetical protein